MAITDRLIEQCVATKYAQQEKPPCKLLLIAIKTLYTCFCCYWLYCAYLQKHNDVVVLMVPIVIFIFLAIPFGWGIITKERQRLRAFEQEVEML